MKKCFFSLLCVFLISAQAFALELDWSGQFWSEYHFIQDYMMDNSGDGSRSDTNRLNANGYYVPGSGRRNASFQSIFLRLRPSLIVNDNLYIKSEWWVGDPIYGVFGSSVPYGTDQKMNYSSQSRGFNVSAQRIWAEFVTDTGTFQVGRVPLDWGLGLVWNAGDPLWSRYMSTGDALRWIAKFGAFTFVPSFIWDSAGNNFGGSCTIAQGNCTPGVGSGNVTEYSLILKYEDQESELEGGINIIKKIGGGSQDSSYGILTPSGSTLQAGAMNYMTYDVFVKKKFYDFSIAAEIPFVTGQLASADYSAVGVAGEIDWQTNSNLGFKFKSGYASGQPNFNSSTMNKYKTFYFNPNYHIAMIMFNYQLANFSGASTSNNPTLSNNKIKSPYDNPISDAVYFSLGAPIKPTEKWTIRPALTYAFAPETVDGSSAYYYNYWTRTTVANNTTKKQGSSLGWEFDLGFTFQWDEYFQFNWDNGLFFPGSYFAFSNTAKDNQTSFVYATALRVGVTF